MTMLQFSIEEKHSIRNLIRKDPDKARRFLRMWVDAADTLIGLGIAPTLIQDTAEQLGLEPDDVLAGIIAGCLNEQFVNEQIAPILGKELLPLALLTLKDVTLEGEERYTDWRRWFQLEKRSTINAQSIAEIIGGIMKFARFLDFDKLTEALDSNQLIVFKSLPMEQAKLLPFTPALRYQKEIFGEFQVGTFFQDRKAGFFNCGEIDPQAQECEACGRADLKKTKDGKYIYCRACNAGYKIKGVVSE